MKTEDRETGIAENDGICLERNVQKDIIVEELKKRGCRITRQRLMLLDVILKGDCSCCKEIYYRAARLDPGIGSATVYRMINTLEDIGVISRKNMYRVACKNCTNDLGCTIEFTDNTSLELSAGEWNRIIEEGLKACGYSSGQDISCIVATTCECARVQLVPREAAKGAAGK